MFFSTSQQQSDDWLLLPPLLLPPLLLPPPLSKIEQFRFGNGNGTGYGTGKNPFGSPPFTEHVVLLQSTFRNGSQVLLHRSNEWPTGQWCGVVLEKA